MILVTKTLTNDTIDASGCMYGFDRQHKNPVKMFRMPVETLSGNPEKGTTSFTNNIS